MKEQPKLSTQEILLQLKVFPVFEETFGIPRHLVRVHEDEFITPIKPMLFIGTDFFANPADLLIEDAEIAESWRQIHQSIDHINSPFTKTNRLSPDVSAHAGLLFSNGMKVKSKIDSRFGVCTRIVLPLSVGLAPSQTVHKTFCLNGVNFQFNLWEPAPADELQRRINDCDGIRTTTTNIWLTQSNEKNSYVYPIELFLSQQRISQSNEESPADV